METRQLGGRIACALLDPRALDPNVPAMSRQRSSLRRLNRMLTSSPGQASLVKDSQLLGRAHKLVRRPVQRARSVLRATSYSERESGLSGSSPSLLCLRLASFLQILSSNPVTGPSDKSRSRLPTLLGAAAYSCRRSPIDQLGSSAPLLQLGATSARLTCASSGPCTLAAGRRSQASAIGNCLPVVSSGLRDSVYLAPWRPATILHIRCPCRVDRGVVASARSP